MPTSVDHALRHWEEKKLLTKKKADELRADLPQDADKDIPHRAIRIFSAVGATLIGLGVILFVASNWQELTPTVKVILLLVGMLGTAVPGFWLAYEKTTYERTGLALLFVNTLIFGASIFLVAQIYNLPLNFWWGMFLWFLGTSIFAYVLQSKLHAWLSVPLFIFFVGGLHAEYVQGFSEMSFLFDNRSNILTLLPLVGIALVSLGILHRNRKDLQFAEGTYFHWGLFVLLLPIVVSTADRQLFYPLFQLRQDAVLISLAVVSLLCFGLAEGFGRFRTNQGRMGLLMLALYVGFVYALANVPYLLGFPDQSITGYYYGSDSSNVPLLISGLYVVHVLLTFVFLLTVIWYGTVLRMAGVINLGILGLGIAILIQYFSWAFEMLDRSIAFILGGIVILVLSSILERQRRNLLSLSHQ